jgi:hypothetical protein
MAAFGSPFFIVQNKKRPEQRRKYPGRVMVLIRGLIIYATGLQDMA